MKKTLIVLMVIGLLAGGSFFIYGKYFKKPGVQVLETAKVAKGDVRAVLVETGIIKPRVGALIKVGARATGTITSMNVKIGDRVRKGQLIAEVDDRELREAIDQQEAAYESAKASLADTRSTYPKRIDEARANYEYAKKTHAREEDLYKKGFTTKDSLDRAQSQLDALGAVLTRLEAELDSRLKVDTASVRDREASLRQQKTRLSYTKIYSPIDGVVADVTARDGETIVAGLQVANLVTVLDPAKLEMWIYVDETDIGTVKPGQSVEYYVDTYPEKTFQGKVDTIYPQPVVKDNIVYFLAIVKVPAESALLLMPEMTTHVKIVSEERAGVLTVPNAAVKYEAGKQFIYKSLGDNKVEKRAVKIGIVGEDSAEVVSGFSEGEEVATKLLLPSVNNSPARQGGR